MIVRDKNYHYLEPKPHEDWVKCELCNKIYTVEDCELWEHSPPHKLEKELTVVKTKPKHKRSK